MNQILKRLARLKLNDVSLFSLFCMIHVLFLQPRTALSKGEDGKKVIKTYQGTCKRLGGTTDPAEKSTTCQDEIIAMNS